MKQNITLIAFCLIPFYSSAHQCLDLLDQRTNAAIPHAKSVTSQPDLPKTWNEFLLRTVEPVSPLKESLVKLRNKMRDLFAPNTSDMHIIIHAVNQTLPWFEHLEKKKPDERFRQIREIFEGLQSESNESAMSSFEAKFIQNGGSIRVLTEILNCYLKNRATITSLYSQHSYFQTLMEQAKTLGLTSDRVVNNSMQRFYTNPKEVMSEFSNLLIRSHVLKVIKRDLFTDSSDFNSLDEQFKSIVHLVAKDKKIPDAFFAHVIGQDVKKGSDYFNGVNLLTPYAFLPREVLFLPEFQEFILRKNQFSEQEAKQLIVTMGMDSDSSRISFLDLSKGMDKSWNDGYMRTIIHITDLIFKDQATKKILVDVGQKYSAQTGQPQPAFLRVHDGVNATMPFLDFSQPNIPAIASRLSTLMTELDASPQTHRLFVFTLNRRRNSYDYHSSMIYKVDELANRFNLEYKTVLDMFYKFSFSVLDFEIAYKKTQEALSNDSGENFGHH